MSRAKTVLSAAPRARRRARCAARGPRRSRSCRRRARRSAPDCSSSCARGCWITRRISSSRPMTGSSCPLRASRDQVAPVLLERLVRRLGIVELVTRWLPRTSVRVCKKRLRRDPVVAQQLPGARAAVVAHHREHQVLDRDVLVLESLRLLLGRLEELCELARHARLAAARPAHAWTALELAPPAPRAVPARRSPGGPAAAGRDPPSGRATPAARARA